MSWFKKLKAARIPKDALIQAAVSPGEKVIAWGSHGTDDPTYVIATDEAMYAQGSRISWLKVIRATWTTPFLDLDVQNEAGLGQHLRIQLSNPGNLPAAVRAQVTANVIVSERLTLTNGCEVLVAARRQNRDEIIWSVVFDAGVDPNDPENRDLADLALKELRVALGI
jgi:hypothetical protein